MFAKDSAKANKELSLAAEFAAISTSIAHVEFVFDQIYNQRLQKL